MTAFEIEHDGKGSVGDSTSSALSADTLLYMDDRQPRVVGVKAINMVTGAEETYRGPVILATGHSARDVYRYLAKIRHRHCAKRHCRWRAS